MGDNSQEKPQGPAGPAIVVSGDVQAQALGRGSALPRAALDEAPGITEIWLGGLASPFGTVSATT